MNVSAAIAVPLRLRVKREVQDGMSLSISSHARYAIRFTRNALSGAFATNLQE
jgi:hypothetical protein